jgi:hypothetical protein
MAKNTLQDLRDHLFATLEALSDTEKPMEIERAKAICSTAQTIIDSARVEVKYIEVSGQGEKRAEKFFGQDPQLPITITSRRNLPA